ncbi:LA2681 family HEPN domain-containing protein [Budvicia aquatica]|uniref:LA2681 family HEPN domain-containing protein n=1 Tax=Budvicia aquatica TaxID=82979 RepID=UPI00207E37A4|nr:LA2681 family HEPN domain-containing protein [Budvicia aquatica]GKX51913.1 hypothetical protein SOASR029_22220 [Budvicia aquatica]
MIDKVFLEQLAEVRNLTNRGDFKKAYSNSLELLEKLNNINDKSDVYYTILSNIAGLFVDIGGCDSNLKSASLGIELMENNKDVFISLIGESEFYYNYSNAKSNFININNPFDVSFHTIEELVIIKNLLWKSNNSLLTDKGEYKCQLLVNLANILQKQFRITESLKYYDEVNSCGFDIPQSWIGRAEALFKLNVISNSCTVKMLREMKFGYEKAIDSDKTPPQWIEYYLAKIEIISKKIIEISDPNDIESEFDDDKLTIIEYESLSDYRKFCINHHLTLSEHALYCQCIASARDDLVIPSGGIAGDFIIPMEMVLNRLKSEFSLARHLFYEYTAEKSSDEILYETCFSELYNDEVLSLDIEKLRTAFRLCFGILDKIAVAVCELYNIYPNQKNKIVYFHNFWKLDLNSRRDDFEKIKSPSLLALYSIATDLENKSGELSFYKEWRNGLEHKFLVVHQGDKPSDLYDSYSLIENIIFINETEFRVHFENLIQITRSAIFSFVFAVRDKGMAEDDTDVLYVENLIYSKDG